MAHSFVLVVLPEEFESPGEKAEIEESVYRIMSPHDTGSISGDYNEKGFFDSFTIGGRFDGAINGLPNYYHEALALSDQNPEKDYGALFRKLADEELGRNSCRVDSIKFPPGVHTMLPERIVLPDSSIKEMPGWFIFPDLVRTADGKTRETPLPSKSGAEAGNLREAWDRAWAEIVRDYGDRLAIGLDCHN